MVQIIKATILRTNARNDYVLLEDYKRLLYLARDLFDYYPDPGYLVDYHERSRRTRKKQELREFLFKENKL